MPVAAYHDGGIVSCLERRGKTTMQHATTVQHILIDCPLPHEHPKDIDKRADDQPVVYLKSPVSCVRPSQS